MTQELGWVLALLALAVAMFIRNRPRMDVVALLMITLLPLTGVITINEALAGFADPNIVLIALLFVVGEGLVRTGVARRLGDWINRSAGGSESRLLVLLMVSVALVGSVMSSTAVVAIFIPVVLRICQNSGMAPSRLLLPVSFAALISGMLTLVATAPNLVVNAELLRQGHEGFGFFTITPFGFAVLVLAVLYMLVARRWLPEREAQAGRERPGFQQWIERYGLAERELRVRIGPDSSLVGQNLRHDGLRKEGLNLLAVERPKGRRSMLLKPGRLTEFRAGDVLLIDLQVSRGRIEADLQALGLEPLELPTDHQYLTDRSQELGMAEVIVTAESTLVGRSVLESRLRSERGITVIGLRHGDSLVGDALLEEPLRVGDTLLVTGFWEDIQRLQQEGHDLLPLALPAELDEVLPAHDKAPQALAILALMVALMVSGLVPNVHAVLIACLLLGLTGCIDMGSAYRAINWKTLVLIVGMMPFSMALQRTGGIDLAASLLVGLFGDGAPRMVLALLFVSAAVLGMFISNTATAILMAPVAITLAAALGLSPLPFAMTVALAASTAFMTPVSSPVNTLVVGPGQYKFADFLKLGVPFSLLVMLTCVLLVPILLPF